MKRICLLFLLLMLIITSCTDPDDGIVDENLNLIEATIENIITRDYVSGCAVILVKDGHVIYENYSGLANRGMKDPITPETPFLTYSISKTFIATALMNEIENEKLLLSDSVNKYLPFDVINPTFPDSAITIYQLLTHTSSIKNNEEVLDPLYSPGDYPMELGTFLEEYLTPEGMFYTKNSYHTNIYPGMKYSYSTVGSSLAAYLVEQVAGVSFDQYCIDSIFSPCCMQNTSWFLSGLDASLVALQYTYDKSTGQYLYWGQEGFPNYPSKQLRSNARSLAKFLQMYMNKGSFNNHEILDKQTVADILTIQPGIIREEMEEKYKWESGLMFYKMEIDGRVIWGHMGGGRNSAFIDTDEKILMVLLSSGIPSGYNFVTLHESLFSYADSYIVSDKDPLLDCDF